jgi:glutamine amidotransferase
MIGIIDYGMGNLRSVQKAFEQIGDEARLFAAPADLPAGGVDRLVLPGVGAFGDGIENLRQRGWIEPIKAFIAGGRPFLGICLGMQLLFEGSEEDAPSPGKLVPGLAILPGEVVRFQATPATPRLKVPHMGWNTITWTRPDPLLAGLEQGAAVYFVHSYYVRPREAIASATAEYPQDSPFCATQQRGNVWATQFHPEKSQRVGLKMLANFAAV